MYSLQSTQSKIRSQGISHETVHGASVVSKMISAQSNGEEQSA